MEDIRTHRIEDEEKKKEQARRVEEREAAPRSSRNDEDVPFHIPRD